MKKIIDENGLFEAMIPITWKYSLLKGKIHTFQEYDIWKHDNFQISFHKIENGQQKRNFEKLTQNMLLIHLGRHTCFCIPERKGEGFSTKAWLSMIDNHMVTFSLTYSLEPVEERPLKEKLDESYEVIKSFRLINEKDREAKLHSYRFEMFLQGVGATAAMLNKAVGNKAFIEATCILASQIDALLRTGIILKNQIINKNSEIAIEWIYQGKGDKPKFEKEVYNEAKKIGVISEDIYNKLYNLYNDRNRVVHRFIISEITVREIEEIAYEFYKMSEEINQIVYDIESEQIKQNVGMTRLGKADERDVLDVIKGKIAKNDYFEKEEIKENPAGNKV